MRACVCGHICDKSPAHTKHHYTLQLNKVLAFRQTHGHLQTTWQTGHGVQPVTWGTLCHYAEETYRELMEAT